MACKRTHMGTHTHKYTCAHPYTDTIHTCTHGYTLYIYTYPHIHTPTLTCTYTHPYTCMHLNINTHPRKHTRLNSNTQIHHSPKHTHYYSNTHYTHSCIHLSLKHTHASNLRDKGIEREEGEEAYGKGATWDSMEFRGGSWL